MSCLWASGAVVDLHAEASPPKLGPLHRVGFGRRKTPKRVSVRSTFDQRQHQDPSRVAYEPNTAESRKWTEIQRRMPRLSGLQRDVLSLYRKCLRAAGKKPLVRCLPAKRET